jgi:hypothetical protein
MMHLTYRFLAAALAFAAVDAVASGAAPERTTAAAGNVRPAETGRWTAELVDSGHSTALVIHDRVQGQRYRLADFEGTPVERVHWLGPAYLEVDYPDHAALLHIRAGSPTDTPTFHLVTTEFNVAGADRVDYYSPPLVALNDNPLTRKKGITPDK